MSLVHLISIVTNSVYTMQYRNAYKGIFREGKVHRCPYKIGQVYGHLSRTKAKTTRASRYTL